MIYYLIILLYIIIGIYLFFKKLNKDKLKNLYSYSKFITILCWLLFIIGWPIILFDMFFTTYN